MAGDEFFQSVYLPLSFAHLPCWRIFSVDTAFEGNSLFLLFKDVIPCLWFPSFFYEKQAFIRPFFFVCPVSFSSGRFKDFLSMFFIFSNWMIIQLGAFFLGETTLLKIGIVFSSFKGNWVLFWQGVNVDPHEWPGQALGAWVQSSSMFKAIGVLSLKACPSWGFQTSAWVIQHTLFLS